MLMTQPFASQADQASYVEIGGGKIAMLVMDSPLCKSEEWSQQVVVGCPQPGENAFYVPTALIFGKDGSLVKTLPFFDNKCVYYYQTLARSGQKLIVMARVGEFASDTISYPDCPFDAGTLLREVRDMQNGKLVSQTVLQNYRTTLIP